MNKKIDLIKRNSFLLLVFFTLFYACDDIVVEPNTNEELYFKVLGGFYEEEFGDMELSSNGNIKIIGSSTTSQDGSDLFYAELNTYGMLVSDSVEQYDSTFLTRGHDIFSSEGSEYIVYSHYESGDSSSVCIVNFADSGSSFADTLLLMLPSTNVKAAEIVTVTTEIELLVQYVDSDGKDNVCLYSIELDGTNELVVQHTLSYDVDEDCKMSVDYADDNILVALTVQESSEGDNNILVFSIKDRNVLWGFTYGDLQIDDRSGEIFIRNNTVYVCATRDSANTDSDVGILQVNLEDGTLLSYKILSEEGDQTLASALITTGGNYMFCGSSSLEMSSTTMFLKKVNEDMEVLDEVTFGNNKHSSAGKILYSSEEDYYYYSGILNASESEDIAVFKLNREGEWVE